MRKHDQIIVDLSVEILRAAQKRSRDELVGTVEVRLALRCLLPHCRERWPLLGFWQAANWDSDGREANTYSSFNGIVLQLRTAGAYQGTGA